MTTSEWAKQEVEYAKQLLKQECEDEQDYEMNCLLYDNALEAFLVLTKQGHSGMSIKLVQNILNQLIDGRPLFEIEDTPDSWKYSFKAEDGAEVYQCKRMASLFKEVAKDGSVTYCDTERVHCREGSSTYIWNAGFSIVEKYYPIKMPYMPPARPYIVKLDSSRKGGVYVDSIILPDGKEDLIRRYFALDDNSRLARKISKAEWEALRNHKKHGR